MSLKNAWKGLFSPNNAEIVIKDNRNNHTFTEEDREHSIEMRRLRQETARMREKMQLMEQRRELEELKADMYGEEEGEENGEEDILNKLMTILTMTKGGTFAGTGINSNNQTPPSSPPQEVRQLSDEQIREFIKSQGKIKTKIAKTMDKDKLKEMIRNKFPITETDFEKAHEILISEF